MFKDLPNVTDADIAFGNYDREWFEKVLKDAEEAGYGMNNSSRAAELFYKGGKLNIDESVPVEDMTKAVRTLKAVIGSFEPKHEHKMAVCEYIIAHIEGTA